MSGLGGITKIPELRKRLLFTILMLAIYRIGVHVPTPGIDAAALQQFFTRSQGTIFGIFNLFSGGALEKLSVLALGVMPYISASIIMELLKVVIPRIQQLYKEGEAGHRKITQYTRYGTVFICIIQGFGIAAGLEKMSNPPVVLYPGLSFKLMTMITLTTGTVFIMWLGEQISEFGVGNGISLIIFAGIAARIPAGFWNTINLYQTGEMSFFKILIITAIMVGVVGIIVLVERGQRRVIIQYAKRVIGRKLYGGQSTHLPLRVNTSGVIPPIFASSIIMFPATIATFVEHPFLKAISESLQPSGMIYNLVYIGFIIFFAYFYTAVTFNPVDLADNLQKYGGYVPGIRPGKSTSDYIDRILTRITLGGAIYLSAICVLPTIMFYKAKVPFWFGGTSLLILVGVALDTAAQIESHLLTRHYEGFMKMAKMRGRRG